MPWWCGRDSCVALAPSQCSRAPPASQVLAESGKSSIADLRGKAASDSDPTYLTVGDAAALVNSSGVYLTVRDWRVCVCVRCS